MVGGSVLSAAACGDLAAGSGSECLGAEVQREVGSEMDGERCDFTAVVLGYDAFVGGVGITRSWGHSGAILRGQLMMEMQ